MFPRHTSTDTTTEETLTEALAEPTSRRQVLTRLAGLGLVAAGGLALLPEDAEAKNKAKQQAKRRRQRRGRPKGKPAGRDQQAGNGRLNSQIYIPDPRIINPIYPSRPPQFRVTWVTSREVRITADCKILFTEEHKALMRAGTKFRLSCEVWESDLPYAPDYIFNLPQVHIFPARKEYPPSFEYPYFELIASSVYLNRDNGTGDSNDHLDDPYALINLEVKPYGGTWSMVSSTRTNEAPGYY